MSNPRHPIAERLRGLAAQITTTRGETHDPLAHAFWERCLTDDTDSRILDDPRAVATIAYETIANLIDDGPDEDTGEHTELHLRFRRAIADPGSIVRRKPDETVPNWASRAVMAVRDEEMATLGQRFSDLQAEMVKAGASWDRTRANLRDERDRAEAAIARMRQLADDLQASADQVVGKDPVANGLSAAEVYEAEAKAWLTGKIRAALDGEEATSR